MVKTGLMEALRIDIYARWRASKPEQWPDLQAELRVVDRLEHTIKAEIHAGKRADTNS